jgi:alpha-ribazole phosphatase
MYIGTTDLELTDMGRAELADKAGSMEYPYIDRLYTSPLKRCVETAEILFPHAQTVIVENLRELDFGEFDGKTVDELIEHDDYKQWLKGGMDNNPPNGESLHELTLRAYKAVDEILMDMMHEEYFSCAAITHSCLLTSIISAFGVPKYEPEQIACGIGEGIEILLTAQMWQRDRAFEIIGRVPYPIVPELAE